MNLQDLDGSGTDQDPYIITDVEGLDLMREDLNATYKLGEDIDASPTENWDGGSGFYPVGEQGDPFTGKLMGNGKVISNFHINRPSKETVGLFGIVDTPFEGKNLTMSDVDIRGGEFVASFVSGAYNSSSFDHCNGDVGDITVTGDVVADGRVAGVVYGMNNKVESLTFEGSVTGNSSSGIIGSQNQSTVEDCHFDGEVISVGDQASATGLIDNPYNGVVKGCTVKGTIYSEELAQGICNNLYQGKMQDCHADVNIVQGSDRGPAGTHCMANRGYQSEIENSSFTGNVSTYGTFNGLMSGGYEATVRNVEITCVVNKENRQREVSINGLSSSMYGGSIRDTVVEIEGYTSGNINGAVQSANTAYVDGLEVYGKLVGGLGAAAFSDNIYDWSMYNCIADCTLSNDDGYVSFMNAEGNTYASECYGAINIEGSPVRRSLTQKSDNAFLTGVYWDEEKSGEEAGPDFTGLQTGEMESTAAKDNMADLSFGDDWLTTDGYPKLIDSHIPDGKFQLLVEVFDENTNPLENQTLFVGNAQINKTDQNGSSRQVLEAGKEYVLTWQEGSAQRDVLSTSKTESVSFGFTSINGTVIDANSDPVEGDAVIVNDAYLKRSVADGSYTFDQIPSGEVKVGWPAGKSEELINTSNYDQSKLEFQYAGVNVSVNHPLTGEPIEGAIVQIGGETYYTNENGRVELKEVPIDEYNVTLMGFWSISTGQLSQGQIKEIDFGGERVDITVGVSVTSPSGKEIEGVDVRITGTQSRGVTNQDGSVEIFATDVSGSSQLIVANSDKRYKTEVREIETSSSIEDFEITLQKRVPSNR